MNSSIFSPNIQYYDHFLMKEVPAFRNEQIAWKKELNLLKKEISQLNKELVRIHGLKFGISIEERSFFLMQVINDFFLSITQAQTDLKRLLLLIGSEKLTDAVFRKELKNSFNTKIKELNELVSELEPVKREAESFIEAIDFIFYNYNNYNYMYIKLSIKL